MTLNYKESWAPNNRCFWTVVLEKTLENPLDCKEIKLINSKGNQSWIFIGRTDAEAPMFGHLIQRPNLLEKTLTGKDWRQKEKGMAEDEMLGWYHRLNGYEFEQAQFSSVHSVVSDSFQPHGPQHTRPPCPSPTPGAYSNSCPSSRWCHSTISSSVFPFSRLPSFPALGSFPMDRFFALGGQRLKLQLQHQSFQWIFTTDFL